MCETKKILRTDLEKLTETLIFGRNGNFLPNKTRYDWFPGKSQNSKKFSAKFKKNPTCKIIGRFLTFWGVKIPPGAHNKFRGQNNIENEFTAPSKY